MFLYFTTLMSILMTFPLNSVSLLISTSIGIFLRFILFFPLEPTTFHFVWLCLQKLAETVTSPTLKGMSFCRSIYMLTACAWWLRYSWSKHRPGPFLGYARATALVGWAGAEAWHRLDLLLVHPGSSTLSRTVGAETMNGMGFLLWCV